MCYANNHRHTTSYLNMEQTMQKQDKFTSAGAIVSIIMVVVGGNVVVVVGASVVVVVGATVVVVVTVVVV